MVTPGGEARVPTTTRCVMARNREGFARIDRPLAFCDCESASGSGVRFAGTLAKHEILTSREMRLHAECLENATASADGIV